MNDQRVHVALARAAADIDTLAMSALERCRALAVLRVDPRCDHAVRFALDDLDHRLVHVVAELDAVGRKLEQLARQRTG